MISRFHKTGFAAVCALLLSPWAAQAEVKISLSVAGGDDTLEQAVIGALSTRSQLLDGDEDPQALVAAAQADYGRVVAAMYGEGFYGPVVSIRLDGREAAEISPFAVPAQVSRIAVSVEPGPAFRFGHAEVAPVPRGTELPEDFRQGEPAKLPLIESAGNAGIEAWRDAGHAKASLAGQSITARHPGGTLDVSLRLNPARKLRFGRLVIKGNEDVRGERIRDIASLPEGETFSPDEIDSASTRLQRTGAFRVVSLTEAKTANPDGTLDVIATLKEDKRRRFGFGAEVTTLEGGTLSTFWLHRNLFGGAERLRISGEVTNLGLSDDNGVDYRLSALFGRPGTFDPDTDFYISASLEHEDEPLYLADTFEVESGFHRIVNDEFEYKIGAGLLYSHTDDDLGERDFALLTFPGSATLDRRDNKLDAKQGYYIGVEATPFAGLNGTGSGARLYADGRAYRSFGEGDRITLAGRVQVGSVVGPELTDTLPDYLFTSGGGGTVRGHSYQSLGVTLDDGTELGGLSFLGASIEVRGQVSDKIQLVGFYDWGMIGSESTPGDSGNSHSGAGFGIRYQTGIGPIRVDVATPVSGPEDDGNDVAFYIGIGQAF